MKPASLAFTCSCSSSDVTLAPGRSTMTAPTSSPRIGIGHPDHGAVGHGGVLEEGGLDLHRVHVLAAPDDHVLGPVDDVVIRPRQAGHVPECSQPRLNVLAVSSGRFQ